MELKEALQGDKWLGHPVHPALIAGPIGMWTLSLVLDGVATFSRNECIQEAADLAVVGGVVAAGAAAATGIAEYTRVPTENRVLDQALLHGTLNASALLLYSINAMIRQGRRKTGRPRGFIPKVLSLLGAGIVGYSGWIGGSMVYNHGVAVQAEPKGGEPVGKRREHSERSAAAEEVPSHV